MKNKLIIFLLFIFIFGCSKTDSLEFNGTNLTKANLSGDFELIDHNGNQKSLIDFKGKVLAVFFGFTNCPDICPTTMLDLKAVKLELGDKQDNLQVLFITADPERDTVETLKEYIPSFDPSFIGLTGNLESIKNVAQQYKVFIEKVEQGNTYTVDHSAGIYLIDKGGKIKIRHSYGSAPKKIAEDILRLI